MLFGQRCAGCGASDRGHICMRCARALAQLIGEPGELFRDEGVAGRMVRAGKSGNWRGAGAAFARLAVAMGCGDDMFEADVITWIPADRRRRGARGGHLPERFARELSKLTGVPARELLIRRDGRPQRGLDRAARLANVANAFAPSACAEELNDRRHVILVDDVRTTGATFDAAVRALIPYVESIGTLAIVGVAAPGSPDGGVRGNAEDGRSVSGTVHHLPMRSGTVVERGTPV